MHLKTVNNHKGSTMQLRFEKGIDFRGYTPTKSNIRKLLCCRIEGKSGSGAVSNFRGSIHSESDLNQT